MSSLIVPSSMASLACHCPPGLSESSHKPLRWPEPLFSASSSAPPGPARTPACRRNPALAWRWRPARLPSAQTRCGVWRACSYRPRDTAPRGSWGGRPPASPTASPGRASATAGPDADAEESCIRSPSGDWSPPRLGPAPPRSWSARSGKHLRAVRPPQWSSSRPLWFLNLLSLNPGPVLPQDSHPTKGPIDE